MAFVADEYLFTFGPARADAIDLDERTALGENGAANTEEGEPAGEVSAAGDIERSRIGPSDGKDVGDVPGSAGAADGGGSVLEGADGPARPLG